MVVNKMALGQIFSDYFGFPCQFSIHRLFHMPIIGRRAKWTQSHFTPRGKNKKERNQQKQAAS
jgi:hypothetical protein